MFSLSYYIMMFLYFNFFFSMAIHKIECLGNAIKDICQSLLIDPGTDHVVDVDSMILNQTSFNYITQNLDLFAFKDPTSKS